MNFGLCTISNGEAQAATVLDAAAATGYDGVEIWGTEPHVGDKTRVECEGIANAAREASLEVAAYGSYVRPGADDFEAALGTELAAAEALGADLVRVWAGEQEYGEHEDDHWDDTVADLTTLVDEASGRGLGVTVEKHGGTLTNCAEGARRLVEAVDRENLGLNYQPMFSLAADEIAEEAEELAPLSNNVHVQAVPVRNGEERCLLEEAFFDVDELLSTFAANGFEGYVNVEFVTEEYAYERAIERDLAYLRSCVE
ncbi:sugar phosphate isomerase/epimerase family protein [Halosolutus gelatinilyticus]|uniref:sugar phosphate isomerase/epimerase family protein n=1 Tax=Halosolutus gelatinilyticus TaxID=2931975 RepID=UPI001FF546E3|nr:TIM barrel protein [Halosolutus gelatinilyticus]